VLIKDLFHVLACPHFNSLLNELVHFFKMLVFTHVQIVLASYKPSIIAVRIMNCESLGFQRFLRSNRELMHVEQMLLKLLGLDLLPRHLEHRIIPSWVEGDVFVSLNGALLSFE